VRQVLINAVTGQLKSIQNHLSDKVTYRDLAIHSSFDSDHSSTKMVQ
jgi:hypothetical protein